jgi:hypothetical protein
VNPQKRSTHTSKTGQSKTGQSKTGQSKTGQSKTGPVRSRSTAFVTLCGLLFAGPSWANPCPTPLSASELSQVVTRVDVAFANLDADSFREARGELARGLACLAEPPGPSLLAGIYRVEAFGNFLDRQPAASVAALRSLIEVSPGYVIADDVAPPGHPLRLYFEIAANSASGLPYELAPVADGWLEIDGVSTEKAPSDRPYLVQLRAKDGSIRETRWVGAGSPPPDYPHASRGQLARAGAPKVKVGLAIASGVTALGAGGLYIAAQQKSQTFWDPKTPRADLDSLRSQTNTLGWLSAGVGVTALGTGAAALLVGTW